MTDKTLGDILEEALFADTPFKSGRTDNFAYPDMTQEEVDFVFSKAMELFREVSILQ